MKWSQFLIPFLFLGLIVGLAIVGYLNWSDGIPDPSETTSESSTKTSEQEAPSIQVVLGDQAQKNLRLVAKPLQSQDFWKSIVIPGMVVDRPGISDREIVAPATGIITEILQAPGDTVFPGDAVFVIKLVSESLHETQTQYYKTNQDIELAGLRLTRLKGAGEGIAQVRVIEAENEIARLETSKQAYRQQLLNYGLTDEQIENLKTGNFVSEVTVRMPQPKADSGLIGKEPVAAVVGADLTGEPRGFEVQELLVEMGEQVQIGQTLCHLSNHQQLAIEGRAFRDEVSHLEHSIKENWPVEVDFQEDAKGIWPPMEQVFHIRYFANTIDPATRTFAVLMPLENQFTVVKRDNRQILLWRFRPGQKVRIRVPVERLENVFVLPADAVVMEGADAYVFTQNVNTFERKSVFVVWRDRAHAVIANDGSLATYKKESRHWTIAAIVRGAAAQLNRMSKTGASDVPKGYHIHADGSLHKNEDEAN